MEKVINSAKSKLIEMVEQAEKITNRILKKMIFEITNIQYFTYKNAKYK